MKLEFSRQSFEKIKFHENLSSGSRIVRFGPTDLKLIEVFPIFLMRLKMTAVHIGKNTTEILLYYWEVRFGLL
jgi:hypothetical protein